MVIHNDMATPASSVVTSGGGKSPASLASRLTCKICGATFVYPGSFTKHMQRHEMSNKRNQESTSSAGVSSPLALPTASMALACQKGLQQVAPQPVVSPSTSTSMTHGYFANSREVDEASANNSMRCQVCGRQFKYKSCLITHIETKHPHGQYNLATAKLSSVSRMPALQCDFCGEVFVYHANLVKHQYKVHRELMHSYSNPLKQQPLSQALSPVAGPAHLPSPIDIKPGVEPYPPAALSAFTHTLPARQIAGDLLSPGQGTAESPSEVTRKDVNGKTEGEDEEEKAANEAAAFHQRFPRNSYECPVCKMTFVYGASFMKHMTRYHPGEEVPYMGPVSRENHLKQITSTPVGVKQEPDMDSEQTKDGQCPDLMSIFETASLRIAGIKQEGLKNLSSEFSFNYNPDGGDHEGQNQEQSGSSNGEVSSGQEADREGEVESQDSDEAGEKESPHSLVIAMTTESSSDQPPMQHASVIVDASDAHLYESSASQMSGVQASSGLDSPDSPKSAQLSSEGGRKYYMCPVCRMEFVYGASFIKHMRRFHPGVPFELPKTGKGRTPSLSKTEDPSVSSTVPEWKLSGPMWLDYSPKPSGQAVPRSQSPPVAMTSAVSSQPAVVSSQQTAQTAQTASGDQYHAKRTRQCPCCSAVFVYVGSLIKHMQKCHPGSNWLSDSNELRNYLKHTKVEQSSSSSGSGSSGQVPIQTRKDVMSLLSRGGDSVVFDVDITSPLSLDIVSRRGQRAHYCRICSKPFFYIASLHKHLLDHGVTPDEVVRLSSLTNPKEDSPSSVPASVLTGMPLPPASQTGSEASQRAMNSSGNGMEPAAKRAKIVSEDFVPIQGGTMGLSLDDAATHRMSLRSRANRLPVNYAELEMEEGEMAATEEDGMKSEFPDNSGVPYVTYHQAQHTVMSCIQQAYSALVALETIQGLARFDQATMPLSPVASLVEGDQQGVSILKSVTTSVAMALQSAGHLGVALSDLQTMLSQRVDEMNQKTVSAVHSEMIQIGERSLVVEAPAGAVCKEGLSGEGDLEDDRRLGIPTIEEEMMLLAKEESGLLTPIYSAVNSPDAKSTSSMETDISPDKETKPSTKTSPSTRGKREKGTQSVAMTTTESDRDFEAASQTT